MKKSSKALATMCILLTSSRLGSASSGGEGFSILTMSPSARVSGMGGASAALVGDVSSLNSNPAGLGQIRSSEISIQHISQFSDVSIESVSYARPWRRGGWGLGAGVMNVSGIKRTELDASSVDGFREIGNVEAGSQFVTAAFSRRQLKNLVLGGSLKAVHEGLDKDSNMAVALDLGGVYRVDSEWRVAAVLQNLGAASFRSNSPNLPMRLRFGAVYLPEEWVAWETDLSAPLHGPVEVLTGGEFNWDNQAFFRVGYKYSQNNPDLGGLAGTSIGVGGRWNSMRLDYAFLPLGDLGESHRISLTWAWGALPSKNDSRRKIGKNHLTPR